VPTAPKEHAVGVSRNDSPYTHASEISSHCTKVTNQLIRLPSITCPDRQAYHPRKLGLRQRFLTFNWKHRHYLSKKVNSNFHTGLKGEGRHHCTGPETKRTYAAHWRRCQHTEWLSLTDHRRFCPLSIQLILDRPMQGIALTRSLSLPPQSFRLRNTHIVDRRYLTSHNVLRFLASARIAYAAAVRTTARCIMYSSPQSYSV